MLAAFALVLQYVLLVRSTLQTIGPLLATVRYLSYFTIVCNTAVLLVAATAALRPASTQGDERLLVRASTRGAVAMYIAIVMGIYIAILRHTWDPQGAQWVADSSLHYAVPVTYLLWWLACVPHGALLWSDLPRWLLMPLVYVVWVFVRGYWVHEYPYPFVDVDQLGIAVALRNCAGIFVLFLGVGAVVIGLDRWLGHSRKAMATS
ncbi:Pr6Pr family membrane protein [Lysobacter fragariae]